MGKGTFNVNCEWARIVSERGALRIRMQESCILKDGFASSLMFAAANRFAPGAHRYSEIPTRRISER